MRSNLVESRMLLTLASGVLLGAFQSTVADTIIPIAQNRSVNTFLIVPQCLGEDFDTDAAARFEPFDSTIETLFGCDSGFGFGTASQQSQIGPNSMTASGTGASVALGPVQNVIHAFGHSDFSVTFELDSESEFTVEGLLSAESLEDPILIFVGATLSLRDANNRVIFDLMVEPGPDGAPNSLVIEQVGLLDPGVVYTLQAHAGSFIDNDVPPSLSGQASFDFVFEVLTTCDADLDGDGAVGPADLAILLGTWGPVPTPDPPDFDGDGDVDASDLAILLGNWGPCP
ncbi:MAG: hypothetical protein O7D91_01910 [Planctomycetota bacterium]|nr:hypothetical protein [Planctomycetota bacterium]